MRDFLCLDYSIHCTPESTMLSQMTEFLSFYGRMLSHNINRLYCLHLSGDWSPKLTPFLRRLYAYTTYMFEVLTQRRSFYTSRFPRGLCALLCRDNHLNRKSQRPPASGDGLLPHLCFLLTPSIDINFFIHLPRKLSPSKKPTKSVSNFCSGFGLSFVVCFCF